MKILRVNMSRLETSFEDLPQEWRILGGRGLSAQILTREVKPTVDPLGPEAKLVIAGGAVAGTLAPSCGRVSVGGKSPLTSGIKEANAGGPAAQKLDRLGIRAIVVEGQAHSGAWHLLKLDKDGARFESAAAYKGMKNYDLAGKMREKFGDKVALISIGPAGERLSTAAAVTFTDKDGDCSRHAGRGGLGAVMGSKGLKAIVIDETGAPQIELADRETFRETLRTWTEVLKADPMLKSTSKYGTPGVIIPLRNMGSMPSRNYSSEPTPGFEALAGQNLEKIDQERGGRMDGCMPGCLVRCSVVYMDKEGKHLTSSYEYETLALMGTNLGITDPDVVARFDRIADDLGLDTIDLGSAMGVAASAGKMEFGHAASAFALLDEVEKGTELGRALAAGVVATAKFLGVTRVPAFRGQAIPAHDPRVTKATGVTYQTSPMGADHTAGISYEKAMSKEGQVERSLMAQIFNAMIDSLGYCNLAAPGSRMVLTTFLKDLINARYGLKLTEDDLIQIGRDTLRTELAFNRTSGFLTAHENVPAFIFTEASAPTGSVFDVDPAEIAGMWDKLDSTSIAPTVAPG